MQNFVDTLRYYTDLAIHVQASGKGDSPHLCEAAEGPFRQMGTVPFSAQQRSPLAIAGHEAWTVRQPWGPCGFIFPWNFPLLLIGWNISPALAAGNTVVIKPAEDTPLSTIYLARLAKEAGIPDGVINVVPGLGMPAGAALASHPGLKRMSFTGSPEVGRSIAAACGQNLVPVKLELGGKGAAVVFDDVDLPQTVEALAAGHHLPHRPGLLRRHPLAGPPVDLRPVRGRQRRAAAAKCRSATSSIRRHRWARS